MIPATYICWMGVRVMSSNSYDGEYMGRIIGKFGFLAVRDPAAATRYVRCSACAAHWQTAGRWPSPLTARAARVTK